MNVYKAANERMKFIFDNFDNVLVAFSCGKDSGVMLNMAYDYAKSTGQLDKLAFYYQDYEAGYKYTFEYADRMFKSMKDVKRKYWICLPYTAACSVSMYEPRWMPWDKDKKEIWVREMPEYEYVLNEDNAPFHFKKGMSGFYFRIMFGEWFANTYGKTAVLVGIRADESLTRRTIFTSNNRKEMFKGKRWSKIVFDNVVNFYPIFDWKTQDIWVGNAKMGWDYNKIYDLYHQAGLSISQMRVASPFHQSGQETLKLYRVIDPHNWGRMIGRVNGVNFGGIYGGSSAMGYRKISKPDHFTWKEYAEFLISTLPEKSKKKITYHLDRLRKTWREVGYGRNPQVIQQMIDEGIKIERTGQECTRCTKDNYYEVVKILSDFPETTKIKNFRRCPSWERVCITIMKNDFTLTYMGCSRSADQTKLRSAAMKKYSKIKNIK